MPFPRAIARANRKIVNPITSRFAGRIAPFAVLIHVGRKSGNQRRTPIMVFPVDDGFAIALTYGRGTDWEKNVIAAGTCELLYRRRRYSLKHPRIVSRESVSDAFPAVVRVVLGANGVDDVMMLDRVAT